ncbi:MAG: AI-2E family transporter [Endomicrobiaceae bacterium]|nr:AI-2E family transporter [Endomicrobiaceae bacterium]
MKDSRVTKFFIISVLSFFCLLGVLYLSRQIIAPFIVSALLCYLISPVINKILLLGVQRWVAVSFITLLIIAFFVFIVTLLVPVVTTEIKTFTENYPKYEILVKEQCNDIAKKVPILKKYTDNITKPKEKGEDGFMNILVSKLETVPEHITSVVSIVTLVVLIPIITFFLLLGASKAKDAFIQFLPAKYVEFYVSLLYEINFVLGGYIRGQIIEVFFIGIATTVILLSFNVKYALIIGIISGIFNVIPYLGPAIAMVSGVLVAAIQYKSITIVLEVFIALEIIQQLDGHVVQPLIVGKNVNLGPVTMIFALLLGANIGGILGMLVSVPAIAILKNILIILTNKYRKALTS